MTYRVHIAIADRGWILEKCASEIARRSSRVSYATEPDPTADIQYYVNYSARRGRVSPVEAAFFTHSERDETARRRYFDIAREVEHCVCMSRRYAEELAAAGVTRIATISPGVDLNEFQPRVRIGVVGRTYHTGRKGEALVAAVMDTPGIEWRFTGSGWPGPSTPVPEGDMASFYNDLDYVLVPALYEGGPMCVLEGLACGVPIISSDVGWSYEYPHIPFENADAESLRAVLRRLVDERLQLRRSVENRTWDAWADQHLELFERLAPSNARAVAPGPASAPGETAQRAILFTHGGEAKTLGGPSVRVPRTARELRAHNIDAVVASDRPDGAFSADIAHVFNVWPAESCFNALARAKAAGCTVVLSPIFLNLALHKIYSRTVPNIFSEHRGDSAILQSLAALRREIDAEPNAPTREPYLGYHARVRACMQKADHVIYLSEYERACLDFIGAKASAHSIVRNPVDAAAFSSADPELFRKTYGVDDYILCVGRIEPRKNQLLLAYAAKRLNKRVVFIGHEGASSYAALVRQTAAPDALFIDRIEPTDPLLKSAFAGASVFALPSWSEGAPLAALEAAASGAPLVLSDRAAEREYLGDRALYVNPADIDGLCEALGAAMALKGDTARRNALRDHMAQAFSWRKYAGETADAYRAAASGQASLATNNPVEGPIYFDLTTTFHFSGNPTGIARVEDRAYRALLETRGNDVIPIAWNSRTRNFLKVPVSATLGETSLDALDLMERRREATPIEATSLSAGGRILIVGGAWIRNDLYVASLRALKRLSQVGLTVLVHDLIQMKLNHLYPEGAGDEFAANAKLIVSAADDFLVYSDVSRQDLAQFLQSEGLNFKRISKFRIGDMTDIGTPVQASSPAASDVVTPFVDRKFILFVSSIDVRKNHALLINVWRRLVETRGSRAPHLVLVGRPLWRGEEVVSTITRDPALASHIHLLTDVSDADLDWFYRHASFTVYPSLYEGWGLPVAESLSYGKVCLTSNNTATREISPSLTDLLDPYDFRAWVDRIALYVDNPSHLASREARIRQEFRHTNWTTSMQEISTLIKGLPRVESGASWVLSDTKLNFSSDGEQIVNEICGDGWGRREKNGRWMTAPIADFCFLYGGAGQSVHIRMLGRGLCRTPLEKRRIRIVSGAADIGNLSLGEAPDVFDFSVPVPADGRIPLKFIAEDVFTPREVGVSPDDRQLGLFISEVYICDDAANLAEIQPPPQTPPALPPRGVSGAGAAISPERLAVALQQLSLPERLPESNVVFRILRLANADRLMLRLYGRMFGRTHDSVRRVIDALMNPNDQDADRR